MAKQMIYGREDAVEALASVCKDYRGTALKALRQGEEVVYIPVDPSDIASNLDMLRDPKKWILYGQDGSKEPCYASEEEFLAGRNSDGTYHKGCFVVDVVAKMVTDIVDRDGNKAVPRQLELMVQAMSEMTGTANSSCL